MIAYCRMRAHARAICFNDNRVVVFKWIPKKIAPEDLIVLTVSKPDFSHEFFLIFHLIPMLSEKIAPADFIFLKVSKPDFSHAVFEFLIGFLYQRRSRLRTLYFSRFLNLISRMLSFDFLMGFLCMREDRA